MISISNAFIMDKLFEEFDGPMSSHIEAPDYVTKPNTGLFEYWEYWEEYLKACVYELHEGDKFKLFFTEYDVPSCGDYYTIGQSNKEYELTKVDGRVVITSSPEEPTPIQHPTKRKKTLFKKTETSLPL